MSKRMSLAAVSCALLVGPTLFPTAEVEAADARVAIVIRDFGNPYWRALRDGAVDEGKKLGVPVTVQAGSTETDAVGENAKISTMANQNYTCFGVVPVNASNVITPLIPISRKSVPILDLDAGLDPAAVKAADLKITSAIGSDNSRAGEMAGDYMLKLLGGKGDVAILRGIPGETNAIAREAAFRRVTDGKLKVVQAQVADFERAKALSATEAMLKVHPDLAGIFADNDEMGLGAAQAIANAGKAGKIKVISVDGEQEALTSVKSGKLSATVSQYPYAEGQMAVQACRGLAAGKTLPAKVEAPIKLISPENVDDALKAFPRPFFTFENPFKAM